MDDDVFFAFLDLLMCSDPVPIEVHEFGLLREFANEEAILHGYASWIDAYHRIPIPVIKETVPGHLESVLEKG